MHLQEEAELINQTVGGQVAVPLTDRPGATPEAQLGTAMYEAARCGGLGLFFLWVKRRKKKKQASVGGSKWKPRGSQPCRHEPSALAVGAGLLETGEASHGG